MGPERPFGRLSIIELDDAFVVVREADPTDWLVRFAREPGFAARAWAEHMVITYNRRLDGGCPADPGPSSAASAGA